MRSALQLTVHAKTRMAQRGIANDDLELITGDVVHEHGRVWVYNQGARDGGRGRIYFVRNKDFQALDRQPKLLRDHARRLVGKRLVIEGNRVVTAYYAKRSKQRRLLCGAEDRPLMERHS